jgi:hypothetical protein
MNTRLWAFGIAVLFAPGICLGAEYYTIAVKSKRIQIDGILMEWNVANADTVAGVYVWDAMHTPEGLAGYLRFSWRDSCGKLRCNMYPGPGTTGRYRAIDPDSLPRDALIYAVDLDKTASCSTAVVEWQLAWQDIPLDSTGVYTVAIDAFTCTDTLARLVLTGNPVGSGRRLAPNRLTGQIISIVVLMTAYLIARARAKKLKRK